MSDSIATIAPEPARESWRAFSRASSTTGARGAAPAEADATREDEPSLRPSPQAGGVTAPSLELPSSITASALRTSRGCGTRGTRGLCSDHRSRAPMSRTASRRDAARTRGSGIRAGAVPRRRRACPRAHRGTARDPDCCARRSRTAYQPSTNSTSLASRRACGSPRDPGVARSSTSRRSRASTG